MTTTGRRRLLVIAALIVATGLAVRVGYVLTLAGRPLEADEADYIESAQGLLAGKGFDATVYYHVPPLPPLLLAAVFAVTGPGLMPAMLFQCALFVAAAWVAFLLGREIAGDLAGLGTLALVSCYPYFIFFTGQVGTEAPALVLIPAAAVAGLRAVRSSGIAAPVAFGLLLAAATLTRAAVLYFVAAVPLLFLLGCGAGDRRWLRGSVAAAAGFAALYLPWCAVNRHYFGEWIATPTIGSGILAYQTALRMTIPDDARRMEYLKREIFPKYYYPPGATHAERLAGDRHLAQEGKRMLLASADRLPPIMWQNFRRFWQFYPDYGHAGQTRKLYRAVGIATYGVLFPFMLVGLVAGLRRFREHALIYLFIAYFTAVHVVLFGKLRYRIPMDPLLLAYSALGLLLVVAHLMPRALAAGARAVGAGFEPHQGRKA